MKAFVNTYILAVSIFLTFSACSRIQFTEVNVKDPQKAGETPIQKPTPTAYVAEKNILLQSSHEQFVQDTASDNRIEVIFSAQDSEGFNVNDLKKENLAISENNKIISDFNLELNQQNIGKKVDLVIVLDVTNSMEETILLVKEKVKGFVQALEQKKWNSTLCLVTFRDHTASLCQRLVEDNPLTPQNENLDYFLGELSKAKTIPSGDWDENQLRGLIDAAEKTPWRNNAQRVEVLMTNSTFSYAPNNKGDAGEDAPTYEETLNVLKKKQVQVFTVAPKAAGYDKAFSSDFPSLSQARGGAYFNFSKMLSGSVPLNQIFQSIIDRLSTEYRLTYSSDSNSLDPELPLSRRQIQLSSKSDPGVQFHLLRTNADWPEGRPELKKKWRLQSQALQRGVKVVKVNGSAVSGSDYVIENSELQFNKAPKTKAVIDLDYDSSDFNQLFGGSVYNIKSASNLSTAHFYINGTEVSAQKVKLSLTQENLWSMDLQNLTETDLFELKVYPSRQLNLKIESNSPLEWNQ